MSDAFVQNKRRFGKGLSYCAINGAFTAMFGIAVFTLSSNECYTIKGSDKAVSIEEYPNANDVTAWFNFTCLLGFIFYATAALSSLGYLTKQGPLNTLSSYTEKISRMMSYIIFIAVHVMRLSHTGKVASGDYLTEEELSDDSIREGYLIRTGSFFLTYILLGWVMVPLMLITMVCIKGEKWAALALDAPK